MVKLLTIIGSNIFPIAITTLSLKLKRLVWTLSILNFSILIYLRVQENIISIKLPMNALGFYR